MIFLLSSLFVKFNLSLSLSVYLFLSICLFVCLLTFCMFLFFVFLASISIKCFHFASRFIKPNSMLFKYVHWILKFWILHLSWHLHSNFLLCSFHLFQSQYPSILPFRYLYLISSTFFYQFRWAASIFWFENPIKKSLMCGIRVHWNKQAIARWRINILFKEY